MLELSGMAPETGFKTTMNLHLAKYIKKEMAKMQRKSRLGRLVSSSSSPSSSDSKAFKNYLPTKRQRTQDAAAMGHKSADAPSTLPGEGSQAGEPAKSGTKPVPDTIRV